MGYYDNMYGWFRDQLRKNYRYRYENAPENVRKCYQPLFYGIIDYASTVSMPVKDLAVIESNSFGFLSFVPNLPGGQIWIRKAG